MARFSNRNIKNSIKRIIQYSSIPKVLKDEYTNNNVVTEHNENKTDIDMTTFEKIQQANSILSSAEIPTKVKRVKKDKGLIERTESSKIVLTEDNKELLID